MHIAVGATPMVVGSLLEHHDWVLSMLENSIRQRSLEKSKEGGLLSTMPRHSMSLWTWFILPEKLSRNISGKNHVGAVCKASRKMSRLSH